MSRRRRLKPAVACVCSLAALAVLTGAPAGARTRISAGSPRYQSVVFWLGWDGGNLSALPWNAVTQVNLFSLASCVKAGDPAPDCTGPASLSEQFNGVSHVAAFVSLVHRERRLALISIGGSTNPDWYYPCGPAHVAAFAHNLVQYMKLHGFDGIDLDIEQDAGTGNPLFTAADLRACARTVAADARAVRTAQGHVPLITSDVDPTTDFDIGKIENPYVPQFNAMSYGAKGATLASEITALEKQSGIPAAKITAGLDVDDYPPPQSDCGGTARYAKTHGLAGAMLWFAQRDAPAYHCLRAIASNLA